jgi:hypothetical protein
VFEALPVPLQVYLFSLLLGVAAPLLVFWMVLTALRHFLSAIFADRRIEAFWLRLIVLVLLLASLSAAVRYRPNAALLSDSVALMFSLADSVQEIFTVLLYALIALFVPLLATYTILHAAKVRFPAAENETTSPSPIVGRSSTPAAGSSRGA